MGLLFEWNAAKTASNLKKHGAAFEEASSVFGDALSLTIPDPDHSQPGEKGWLMKKVNKRTINKNTRGGYDFSGGIRGKYASKYAEGTNLIVLDPDVAKWFPDSESVNRALRACGEIIRTQEARRAGERLSE